MFKSKKMKFCEAPADCEAAEALAYLAVMFTV